MNVLLIGFQLHSSGFSWCVISSLRTQNDSFSTEPCSFRQTFGFYWWNTMQKETPMYLSDISFVFSVRKLTKRQRPLISFLYSILSNNLLLSGLKSPSLFYFMTAWQIYGVDIVLSCRLLNIRVPRKIIFLRVKM